MKVCISVHGHGSISCVRFVFRHLCLLRTFLHSLHTLRELRSVEIALNVAVSVAHVIISLVSER